MPTENHSYFTPERGSTDWDVPLNSNTEQLDTDVEIRDTDTNRSNYTPKDGAKFFATDTGTVYIGDGSAWNSVGTIGGSSGGSGASVTKTVTKSGDGTAATFTVSHSLGATPAQVIATPGSEDAMADFYVTNKTSSSVDIAYSTPPPSGTDNLTWDVALYE